MMKFHPNQICFVTFSATFGLAQILSVECQGVLRVPSWCYKFCIASCSINKEENENLECFWLLVMQ
jgi:hypothetical protein